MSYVAECEQCGVLERGEFEEVGDAAEDHDQFHAVQVKRAATDGGVDIDGLSVDEDATIDEFAEIAEDEAKTIAIFEEPGDIDLTLVELAATYLDPNGALRTFSITADDFDPDDHEHGDSEEVVTVSTETARAALLEVEAAIERTGGPGVGADEACSPLAAVREAVAAEPGLDEHARGYALAAIDGIADKRGVDASGADPLTDATFQAWDELQEVLDEDDGGDAPAAVTDGGNPPGAASAGAQVPRDGAFATDEAPHKCDICLRVFDELAKLRDHDCRPLAELVDADGGGRDV
ncbi:hypothetical protein HZS55_09005 [Halosimplex rubrum]|uniref:C2H2-type domain-containing protein n=1 Tax=Halosimplex rubrum TaxID=869889 RepID=A0A7D5SVI4_9EURY|nr:hypothetical protein [Halosimplex rubrum]QLH75771.1 hypothetical protein HZS55_09005 [Halosimplex rubrum]